MTVCIRKRWKRVVVVILLQTTLLVSMAMA